MIIKRSPRFSGVLVKLLHCFMSSVGLFWLYLCACSMKCHYKFRTCTLKLSSEIHSSGRIFRCFTGVSGSFPLCLGSACSAVFMCVCVSAPPPPKKNKQKQEKTWSIGNALSQVCLCACWPSSVQLVSSYTL